MENRDWLMWHEARLPLRPQRQQQLTSVRAWLLEVSFVAKEMAMCLHFGSNELEVVASELNVLELD